MRTTLLLLSLTICAAIATSGLLGCAAPESSVAMDGAGDPAGDGGETLVGGPDDGPDNGPDNGPDGDSGGDSGEGSGTTEDPRRAPGAMLDGAGSAAAAAADTGGKGDLLVEVGADRIHASEVVQVMIDRHRSVFDSVVQDLLIRRVVAREQAVHQVVVPNALIDADVRRDEDKAERYSRLQYQMSFQELLKRQGRTIEQFRAVARSKALHTHTLYRLVRHAQLKLGLLKVRHIVVKKREEARRIRTKLQEGASFVEMARQHSMCPTRTSGGELAMVVPGLYARAKHEQVEKALWALESGELSPVVEAKTGFHVFQALHREPARDVPYSEAAAQVEASLKKYSVMDEEVEWWLQQIRPRYPIKQHFK